MEPKIATCICIGCFGPPKALDTHTYIYAMQLLSVIDNAFGRIHTFMDTYIHA